MKSVLSAALAIILAWSLSPATARASEQTFAQTQALWGALVDGGGDLPAARRHVAAGLRLPPDMALSALETALFDKGTERLVVTMAAIELRSDSRTRYPLPQALGFAASLGRTAAVRLLLDAGTPVSGPGYEGRTALQNAAKEGRVETMAVLVAAGADVNEGGRRGTALFIASSTIWDDAVKLLLKLGADPNKGIETFTPLSEAAHGRVDNMRLLLAAGADPNGGPASPYPPLHVAANRGDMQAIQLLLDAHARTDLLDKDGETPAQLATAQHHPEAAMLISSVSIVEGAEHRARKAEIAAATAREFTRPDLGFDCEQVLMDLSGDREEDPDDVALEQRRRREVRAAAEKFRSCVQAYSGTTPPGEEALVPPYRLLHPLEKAAVDKHYEKAVGGIPWAIQFGSEFIEKRLRSADEDVAAAEEAQELKSRDAADRAETARARAAADADTHRWLASVNDSLRAVQRRMQPATPQIDRAEFAARIAEQHDGSSSSSSPSTPRDTARRKEAATEPAGLDKLVVEDNPYVADQRPDHWRDKTIAPWHIATGLNPGSGGTRDSACTQARRRGNDVIASDRAGPTTEPTSGLTDCVCHNHGTGVIDGKREWSCWVYYQYKDKHTYK